MDNILKEALLQAFLIETKDLPSEEELSKTYTFTPEFEKKMQKLINKTNKKYITIIGFTMRRAVAILLLIFMIASATLSVKAIREPFIDFLMEVFPTFSRITFSPYDEKLADDEFIYLLPVSPKGYAITKETKLDGLYDIEFTNADGNIIYYSQQDTQNAIMRIDTEGIDVMTITINGREGISYSNKGFNTIIWTYNRCSYMLNGACDFSVLEKMANSIK